ncbi:DUF6318 family protein [Dermabacter hominis]|uniref:DUF6318 family protein n=1 Tax=Dermabacter hominis TaxID=36740 RepID=UPI0021A25ECD|nr:DUF6318 family protein [Dermabacter hominis]MCT1716903.1 DUF6318 family protein [Dermabacter hominis]
MLSTVGTLAIASAALTSCHDDATPVIGPTPVAHTATANGGSDGGGAGVGTGEAPGRTDGLPPRNSALTKPDGEVFEARHFATDEGAKATARYVIAALYYGYATGDTAPYESVVSLGACKACGETLAEMDRWRENKQFASVVGVTPGEISIETTKDGYVVVRYQFTIEDLHPGSYGGSTEDQPTEQHTVNLKLDFSDGEWLVLHFDWLD